MRGNDSERNQNLNWRKLQSANNLREYLVGPLLFH